jgi:hypothetical protein
MGQGKLDILPYVLRGSFMLKSVRELQGHPRSRDCCPAFGSKGTGCDSADPSIKHVPQPTLRCGTTPDEPMSSTKRLVDQPSVHSKHISVLPWSCALL